MISENNNNNNNNNNKYQRTFRCIDIFLPKINTNFFFFFFFSQMGTGRTSPPPITHPTNFFFFFSQMGIDRTSPPPITHPMATAWRRCPPREGENHPSLPRWLAVPDPCRSGGHPLPSLPPGVAVPTGMSFAASPSPSPGCLGCWNFC